MEHSSSAHARHTTEVKWSQAYAGPSIEMKTHGVGPIIRPPTYSKKLRIGLRWWFEMDHFICVDIFDYELHFPTVILIFFGTFSSSES